MPLVIDHPDAERLARQLAEQTGQSVENAVLSALRAQVPAETPPQHAPGDGHVAKLLMELADHCSSLPVLDARSPGEILGYNRHGVWD